MKTRKNNRQGADGYSTFEMMVVALIVSIAGMLVLPSLIAVSNRHRRDDAMDMFVNEVQRARTTAISEVTRVNVAWDGANHALSVAVDRNKNSLYEVGETVLVEMPDTVSISPQGTDQLGEFDTLGRFIPSTGSWRFIEIDAGTEPTKYVVIYAGGNIQRWTP